MTQNDETPIFYSLPADKLTEGLSTDDGQDIIDVSRWGDDIHASVYTPRSDDPGLDESNRLEPEVRIYSATEMVDLAIFADTSVDGRHLADEGASA